MIVRRRTALAVGVAALAVGTALGISGVPDGSTSAGQGGSATASADGATSDPTGASGTPEASEAPGAPEAPTASRAPKSASGGAPSTGAGLEPAPSTADEGPGGGPGTTKDTDPPHVTMPAEAAFATGRLVRDYPAALLPAAPRSRVLSSSVSPSGGLVQVALVARGPRRAGALLLFYRQVLEQAGFVERPTTAVGGASAAAFGRDGSRVVVTVDPPVHGKGRSYSVFAILDLGEA